MLKNVQESTGGTWTCEIPLKTIHRDRKMCDVWQICASVWLRKHAASSSNGYTRCRLQLLLIWILCYTYPKLCNPITVCFPVGGNVGCDISDCRVVFCVIIFILSILAYKMVHFLFFYYKIQSLNWNSYNNAFPKKNLIWNKNQQLSGILVILYTICLVSEYFFSCHMQNKKFQAFKTWILN